MLIHPYAAFYPMLLVLRATCVATSVNAFLLNTTAAAAHCLILLLCSILLLLLLYIQLMLLLQNVDAAADFSTAAVQTRLLFHFFCPLNFSFHSFCIQKKLQLGEIKI